MKDKNNTFTTYKKIENIKMLFYNFFCLCLDIKYYTKHVYLFIFRLFV